MENGQRWANVQKACKEKVNNAVRMKTPALVLVVHHPAPPAHTFSRTLGESPSRTRCREGTTVTEDAVRSAPVRPPAPPVSYAAACRTAPCRPKATDLLTSALPHHQAPGALTPGWPHASLQSRVSSATDAARHSLAGTCCPAVHEHNPSSALTASYTSRSRIRAGT